MIRRVLSRIAAIHSARKGLEKPVVHRANRSRNRDPELEDKARIAVASLCPALAASVKVGWNTRLRTTAGIAILTSDEIWLNPALPEVSHAEVERTLLHELAHLLARHRYPHRRIASHGTEWVQACKDLGIGGETRTHRLPFHRRRLKRHFLLHCPVCGRHHERVRIPKRPLACLFCCRAHNHGLYDNRFRLIVKRINEEGVS
jgi:predicted SprT family Zn-dependent metalloprotease